LRVASIAATLACIALSLLTGVAAQADGSVDLSTTVTTLRSPANTYGPWVSTTLSVRLPPDRETGFEITNRRASDRLNPTTARFLEINNYHKFSRAISTYIAVAAGSAPPFPQSRFAAEVDVALSKHIGLALGGSTANDYVIGGLRQARLGLDYFFGDNYASIRYIPTWSALLGSSHAYSFALRAGVPGKTTETLRLGGGGENDASLINPLNPTLVGEVEIGASLSLQHWTRPERGYHIDVGYGSLNRSAGGQIYSALSLGGGFFFALH